RQVLADLDAGDAGGDLLELTAVGVAGLEVPQVDGAGSAVHPQQDARPLALRVAGHRGSEPLQPARRRVGRDAGRRQAEQVTARESIAEVHGGLLPGAFGAVTVTD